MKYTTAIIKCSSYSHNLKEIIAKLLNEIGGIGSFVRSGQTVLIKPNMLTDRTPNQAVTTHPEIVRAIIQLVRDVGATPCVADSPASAVKTEQVWAVTGFGAMCEEENVPLINLEKSGSKKFEIGEYIFNVAQPVIDADVVINVPKVKTHTLTLLTAAVKNFYGTLPGYQKAHKHKAYPKPYQFGKFIQAIYSQIPPCLNIADAITGMDGNGPSAGNPVDLGFIAASSDAIALDLTLCRILKINPQNVPYLRSFTDKYNSIDIKGTALSEITPAYFRLPSTLPPTLIPQWLVNILDPFMWIRPHVLQNCTACSRCVKSCPVEALKIDASLKKAVLNDSKCISCCCCHEICPEKAIEMIQSPLLNLIRRGKRL